MSKTRKWYTKGLYIVFALALLVGLSVTPVSATSVSQPVVTVSPNTQDVGTTCTINFTVVTALVADSSTINIDFDDYDAVDIVVTGDDTSPSVTVNGHLVIGSKTVDGDDGMGSVSDTEIQITVPEDISAGENVEIIIPKASGMITNPSAQVCTLWVETSTDVGHKESASFIIAGYPGKGVELFTSTGVFIDSYLTIADAETAASTGYIIRVDPGTYAESLTINQATKITLESTDGKDSTIIKGQMLITDTADGFVLGGAEGKGFTFQEGASIQALVRLGDGADNVTISYNAFDTKAGTTCINAIHVSGASTGLTVTENSFTLHEKWEMGVASGCGGGRTVSGFTITNNTFTGCGNTVDHSGIELKQLDITSTSTTISGNTFSDFYVGIMIGSDQEAGEAGLITGTAGTGVLKISGNTFDGCRYGLDIVNAKDSAQNKQNLVVVGNTFSGCTFYGMDIDYGPCAATTSNLEPDDFAVKFNNFSGNTKYGLYNNVTTAVAASHNWWGDAAGPSSGDKVSSYVGYSPYLGASVSAADYSLSTTSLNAQSTVGAWVTSSTAAAVGVAKYTSNPQGTPEFTALGYFDVYSTAAAGLVTIKLYDAAVTSDSEVWFWSATENDWIECYKDGAVSGDYAWVEVRAYDGDHLERVPVLTDLVNLPFAIGTEEAVVVSYYDEDGSGLIEIDELLNAISDYIGGVPGADISLLLEVISAYINETAV